MRCASKPEQPIHECTVDSQSPARLAHLLAESDARYGGFDFRAAHAEADADLKELLDNNESLVRGLLFLLSFCRNPLLP